MLAQWFGPEGFTNPVCTCDARVGGEIHIIMRANDEIATAMGFRDAPIGEFKQVDSPPAPRLHQQRNGCGRRRRPQRLTTVIFEDLGGRTKMTFHTVASGTLPQVPFMLQGMEAGWTQSFDKMDALFARK
jgi:uncharacterized protein YndB with AHSA1/START domain